MGLRLPKHLGFILNDCPPANYRGTDVLKVFCLGSALRGFEVRFFYVGGNRGDIGLALCLTLELRPDGDQVGRV